MNHESIRLKYRKLTKYLIEKNLTITTMESATSGQIASLITDTEGSSAILKGAFVTYCNEAKIQMGVPKEIIDTYSVYSKETAIEMAKASQKAYNADIAVGVTGTMGNIDPNNEKDSILGEVYFAIYFKGKVYAFQRQLNPQNTRLDYKLLVADQIVEEIFNLI